MSEIVIKNIEHSEKTSKAGKPYTSCKITVWNSKENRDTFISGFGDAITKSWNSGDMVDVTLSQNEKGYWNFTINQNSKPSEKPEVRLLKLILDELRVISGRGTPVSDPMPIAPIDNTADPTPALQPSDEVEIKVEDIPF
jgi:hypothetical protein